MPAQQNFIVIDTEGKHELREIAIIDSQGKLVYEAFTKGHWSNDERHFNVKPLKEIVVDFFKIAHNKLIIFHSAQHDIRVLKNSCKKAGLVWQNLNCQCSYELAKSSFPGLSSYSLEYLSKRLNLKVNKKYFNPKAAHTARYDAEFTYQLYRKVMNSTTQNTERDNQQYKPNPYGSIKVATPFQDHVDYKQLYQAEFESLKRIINDIKHDNNHQSQGVVVIGEPGSGKTHLMMRLAKELLKVNRLLFIPQPAHPDSVLYHTYSRILESFFEEVPGTKVRQLEHLLANSFVKLISTTTIMTLTNRDQEILAATRENPLNLYESLGTEGSNARLAYWQRIETRTNNWWMDKYGTAGYSPQIIKGIVKFCSYSNLRKKELVARWLSANELTQEELDNIGLSNWNEEMSKEEFSLQAISVFSRLSLLDEPLIIVFDQLESLGYEHKRNLLISFGEAVKEIFTHVPNSLIILNLFPDRWKQFQDIFDGSIVDLVSQHEIYLQKPSNEKLQEILRLKAQAVGVDFDGLFNSEELEDICKQESIRKVLKRAANYYKYKVDGIRFSEEIERLNNTANGRFMIMEKEDRINFELIYRLITDIQNKDEEFEIEKALQVLMSELENYWLIKVFQFEEI